MPAEKNTTRLHTTLAAAVLASTLTALGFAVLSQRTSAVHESWRLHNAALSGRYFTLAVSSNTSYQNVRYKLRLHIGSFLAKEAILIYKHPSGAGFVPLPMSKRGSGTYTISIAFNRRDVADGLQYYVLVRGLQGADVELPAPIDEEPAFFTSGDVLGWRYEEYMREVVEQTALPYSRSRQSDIEFELKYRPVATGLRTFADTYVYTTDGSESLPYLSRKLRTTVGQILSHNPQLRWERLTDPLPAGIEIRIR